MPPLFLVYFDFIFGSITKTIRRRPTTPTAATISRGVMISPPPVGDVDVSLVVVVVVEVVIYFKKLK